MDRKQLNKDEEEAFRKFIVVEEDISTANPVKQPNTKPQQMNRIIEFADDLSSKQLTKSEYSSQWEVLARELNDIGPPEHTGLEWRRIWTAHKSNIKYNKKKRAKSDSSEEVTESLIVTNHEQSTQEKKSQISNVGQCDDEHGSNDAVQLHGPFATADEADISVVILEKMSVLMDKQNEMISLVTGLIQWLKLKVCAEGIVKTDLRKSI
ncbi:hypothetical protein HA402_013602 [Bradysia odoriphaga]|nr:hypothetical protein HA402_013602 [Bradysia odoriphaga]